MRFSKVYISRSRAVTKTNIGIVFLAVLITGNWNSPRDTAELYLLSTGVSCRLPQLPDDRNYHTVDSKGLLCGGGFTSDTCLQWSPDTGTWEDLLTLSVSRYRHVSWTPGPDLGTYLMGGLYSGLTTTLIKPDGNQEPGFLLKHDTE